MYLRNRTTEQQIMAITNFVTSGHTQHTINPTNCSMLDSAGQSTDTCSCICHVASKSRKQLVLDSSPKDL